MLPQRKVVIFLLMLIVKCTWLVCADYCSPKYLSCPCGSTSDRIVIAVDQCGTQNQNSNNCQSCDGITDFQRCSFFENCTSCTSMPVDCTNCLNGKISTWRRECSWRYIGNRRQKNECQCFSRYKGNLGTSFDSVPAKPEDSFTNEKKTENANACIWPVGWRSSNGGSLYVQEGSTMYLTCDEGYDLVGTEKVICLNGGMWNSKFPTCAKSCVWPAGWYSDKGGSRYVPQGSSMDLTCDIGYDLVGLSQVNCLRGGTWSHAFPRCVPSNVKPKPEIGNVNDRENDKKVVIKPILPTTQRLAEEPTIDSDPTTQRLPEEPTIDSDPTTQRLPEEPTFYPDPTMPLPPPITQTPMHGDTGNPNANKNNGNCKPGMTQMYSCEPPYEVDGIALQKCLPNAQWEAEPPKCRLRCGRQPEPKVPQIINGSIAQPNAFPWQVALTTYATAGEYRAVYCGGSLISEKYVLTAAHCITEYRSRQLLDVNTLLLYFAKHYTDFNIDNNDVVTRKVSRLILHPNYEPSIFESDLGLIRLQGDISISEIIMPLCLPPANSMATFQEGLKGTVAGWGNIDNNNNPPPALMMLQLPVVDNKECEESYRQKSNIITITENMFCAGLEEGGKNPCLGDSGSPMAFRQDGRYFLEGIVSWGSTDECAGPGLYGVFVRVRNFIPWITAFVPVP